MKYMIRSVHAHDVQCVSYASWTCTVRLIYMNIYNASHVLHEHVQCVLHAHEVHGTHCACSWSTRDALYMLMKYMRRTVHVHDVHETHCTCSWCTCSWCTWGVLYMLMIYMMLASWHQKIFRIAGDLWGESIRDGCVSLKKGQYCRISLFYLLLSRTICRWFETQWHYRDVTVLTYTDRYIPIIDRSIHRSPWTPNRSLLGNLGRSLLYVRCVRSRSTWKSSCLGTNEECCTRSGYQRQGQVISPRGIHRM